MSWIGRYPVSPLPLGVSRPPPAVPRERDRSLIKETSNLDRDTPHDRAPHRALPPAEQGLAWPRQASVQERPRQENLRRDLQGGLAAVAQGLREVYQHLPSRPGFPRRPEVHAQAVRDLLRIREGRPRRH